MVKLAQRYARAAQSSNLRSDADHCDTDYLAAVALTRSLGSVLFRVKYGNDQTTYNQLLNAWRERILEKATRKNWVSFADPVACISLEYWLNDICPACTGKGHPPIPFTPVLSNEDCPVCLGTGRKPLLCDVNIEGYVRDAIEHLDRMVLACGDSAIKKLADSL